MPCRGMLSLGLRLRVDLERGLAGLRIENRDVSSLASVLGGKFTYTHSADWGVLILFGGDTAAAVLTRHGIEETEATFIEKPYTAKALAAAVRAARS